MEAYPSFMDLVSRAPNPAIAIFIPVFLATTLLEMAVILIRGKSYPWRNAGVSVLMAVGHFITQAAAHGVIFGIIAAFVYQLRLTTIPVSLDHWGALIVLFVLADLAFYVEHRCSHRIRFLWASHSVHHSSEKMLATTAYRLSWTPLLSGVFLFYLPIVWIGYDPVWVYGMASASLAYQFFVHTELVPRIGWLEWAINTPSAHRVHHASNPEYIDKNYGGVLLIWDHLFGTYQAERADIPIRYGLVHGRSAPDNPFVVAYEELWLTLKRALLADGFRALGLLVGPALTGSLASRRNLRELCHLRQRRQELTSARDPCRHPDRTCDHDINPLDRCIYAQMPRYAARKTASMNSSSTFVRFPWLFVSTAAVILLITMGARQTIGLFVAPLDSATGLGIVSISLAVAVGQFIWGFAQPVFGAVADRYGPGRVIAFGGVMLALGTAATPFVQSEWQLIATLGVVSAFGAGAGSLAILIGAIMQRMAGERRSLAAGIINAGGSLGQFVFAPVVQAAIFGIGWVGAMIGVAAATLATVPLALLMRRRGGVSARSTASTGPAITLRQQLREAAAERSYWWLHLGFFTCGFHVAFLVTHLPGEVALCGLSPVISANAIAIIGLANVAGSLGAGWLGTRYRMKHLLFWIYGGRAAAILCFMLAPKTALTFYIFATALGVTWLATLPPTAGLVGKLFGTQHLSMLIGLTMLSHQMGAFYGAWLGGIAVARFGDYNWMFYADALLATFAALINLPIREAPVVRPAMA